MATKKEEAQIDIIINGQKATATIADMEKATKTLNQQIKLLTPGTAEFVKKTEELKKINGRLSEVKKEVSGVSNGISGMVGEMEKLGPAGSVFANLRGGFAAMSTSVLTVARSFFTLGGAMLAVPIFALVAGFTALVSYFRSTDEGADMLEQAMAGLGAVMQVITGIFAKAGKVLVGVFSDPKQAVKDLVNTINTMLLNSLKGWLVVWEGIRKADFKKVTDGVIQIGTGIENATDKARAFGAELEAIAVEAKRAALVAADLTRQSQDLADAERDLSVINAKRKGDIDELILKTKQVTLSDKERIGALREAGKVEEAMSFSAIALAKKRLDIIRQENAEKERAVGDIGDEDKDREAEAAIKVINLLNESKALRQTIANRESKFIKELADERQKAIDKQRKEEEDAEKKIFALKEGLLTNSLADRRQKLVDEANRDLQQVIGTETQKAEQRKLIEAKLLKDLAALEDASEAEAAKIREQNEKEAFERQKKYELELAEFKVKTAKGSSDAYLKARQEQIDTERKYELANKDLTESESKLINDRYDEESRVAKEEHRNEELEKDKALADQIGSYTMQGLQAIADFKAIQAQKDLNKVEKEKDARITALDKSLAAGNLSRARYDKLKAQAEADADKKTREIKTKQAKTQKTMNIIEASMATALAVVKALPNPILAILAGVMGGLAIAKIAATPLPTFKLGGMLSRGFNNVKSFFSGGIIQGSKHGANYGDSGISLNDRVTGRELGEMQGNEIILTEGVTNNPYLRAEASRINVAGGGRSFEQGGMVSAPSASPAAAAGYSEPLLAKMDEQIEATKNLQNIIFRGYVVYKDLEDAKNTIDDIKAEAKL